MFVDCSSIFFLFLLNHETSCLLLEQIFLVFDLVLERLLYLHLTYLGSIGDSHQKSRVCYDVPFGTIAGASWDFFHSRFYLILVFGLIFFSWFEHLNHHPRYSVYLLDCLIHLNVASLFIQYLLKFILSFFLIILYIYWIFLLDLLVLVILVILKPLYEVLMVLLFVI